MTRAQATEQLEALGAVVSKSVTKKTDILFCGERAGMKLEKAEEYGIPIYKEADFSELVGDEAAIKRAAAAATAAEVTTDVEVLQEIADGETVEVQGSAAKPYVLSNTGGVYSCSCPAWRNQSAPIDLRSCKHLAKVRGAAAETARVGRKIQSVKASKSSSPKVLLAQKWEADVDPTGWWMSEKLDGVRAIWTGESFVSRQGNPFYAPDWFVADFPDVALDGELWIGRGKFQATVSVARRQDKSDHWKEIRFVMFDAPDQGGPFEERMEYMHAEFGNSLQYASVLEHVLCEGMDHLSEELARVEGLLGEGLMLRQAKSEYIGSRSATLLKVKTFHDAEAKVIGYKGGQGRHRNRVGALELITPEGVTFFAGTGLSDAERENPPEIGALVTYRFQELTDAGVPRFPTYVGVRIDGTWDGPEPKAKATTKTKAKVKAPVGEELVKDGERLWLSAEGDTVSLRFESASAAKKGLKALKDAKLAEGFAPAAQAPKPKAKQKKKQVESKAASAGAQRFECVSGSSSKFWEITVTGSSHTVRYGKTGSKGASKEKVFADAAKAKKDAERLIRQKTGKGYEAID